MSLIASCRSTVNRQLSPTNRQLCDRNAAAERSAAEFTAEESLSNADDAVPPTDRYTTHLTESQSDCHVEPTGYSVQPNGYTTPPTGRLHEPTGYARAPTGYKCAPTGYARSPAVDARAPTGYAHAPTGSARASTGHAEPEPLSGAILQAQGRQPVPKSGLPEPILRAVSAELWCACSTEDRQDSGL